MPVRQHEIHWVTRAAFFALGVIFLAPTLAVPFVEGGVSGEKVSWLAPLALIGFAGCLALRMAYRGTAPASLINGSWEDLQIKNFNGKILVVYLYATVAIAFFAAKVDGTLALGVWLLGYWLAGLDANSVARTNSADLKNLILKVRGTANTTAILVLGLFLFVPDWEYQSTVAILVCPVLMLVAGSRWLLDFTASQGAQDQHQELDQPS